MRIEPKTLSAFWYLWLQCQKSFPISCLHEDGDRTLWHAPQWGWSGAFAPWESELWEDCGSAEHETIRVITIRVFWHPNQYREQIFYMKKSISPKTDTSFQALYKYTICYSVIFTNLSLPCPHTGHTKSSGNGSWSVTYPHTVQR